MRFAISVPGSFILLVSFLACEMPLPGALNQLLNRYVAIGAQDQALLLASDSSGNLFAVATVTEASGRPQIRVIKTDPQGNPLSSIDFGSSTADLPAAAAVDRQGNLWVVGSTSGSDFPLVSPLFSKTTAQAAFVVELDSQLRQIVFSTGLGGTQGGGPIPGGTWGYGVALDGNGNTSMWRVKRQRPISPLRQERCKAQGRPAICSAPPPMRT